MLTYSTYMLFLCISLILIASYYLIKHLILKKKFRDEYNNIKSVKRLIKNYKLKYIYADLHVLDNSVILNSEIIEQLFIDAKIINFCDGLDIAITSNTIAVISNYRMLPKVNSIKLKLGLKFYAICIHYCIDHNDLDIEKMFVSACEAFPVKETKNITVCFNSTSDRNLIDTYNSTISKENTIRLHKKAAEDHNIASFFATKTINSDSSIDAKYFNISTLSKIESIINKIYSEIQKSPKDVYVLLLLNSSHCRHTKSSSFSLSIFNSRSILVGLLSLGVSALFISNIISQINFKKDGDFRSNPAEYTPKQLQSDFVRLKNKIDSQLWFHRLYPYDIKYMKLYSQYADIMALNILLPAFNKVNDLSILTAFLVYFINLDENTTNDDNAQKIIEILSDVTTLSYSQLLDVIKYTSPATKIALLEKVDNLTTKLVDMKEIKVDSEFDAELSLEGFNSKYLGESSEKRAVAINNLYKSYLYRCSIDKLLPGIMKKYIVSKSTVDVFDMYKLHFSGMARDACDSTLYKLINSDVSTAIYYASSKNLPSFDAVLKSIDTAIQHIEQNDSDLSLNEDKEIYKKVKNSIVKYIVNTIVNESYKLQGLPLLTPIDTKLYMEFKPNFYADSIETSPIYSKKVIFDVILPLKSNFDTLIKKLDIKYNIKPELIISIYNDSISLYKLQYINSYKNIIDQLNKNDSLAKKISNESSLSLYLIEMNSKGSTFNNLVRYYGENTSVVKSDEAKDIPNFFEPINSYFNDNNAYLGSEKYDAYSAIFMTLNQLLKDKGYVETYRLINNKYEPLKKVYSDLSTINNIDNDELFLLLKKHLDAVILAIQAIAADKSITILNSSISSEYAYANDYIPFNKLADVTISDNLLLNLIGNTGTIYTGLKKNLEPLLRYNQTADIWYNNNLTSHKEKFYINLFNKIYLMNKYLWNRDGLPKAIELEITPMAEQDQDYLFKSIILNSNNYVNSLNVGYSNPINIDYKWSVKEAVTIVIKLSDGETVEKTYSGDWAVIKALKDAKCTDDIYTWLLEHKGKKYPISFKITSKLFDALNKEIK